jgi:hypothetical protein
MIYIELKKHASDCQIAADEMAYKLIKIETISVVQSICDFNLSWLYQEAPEVILHFESIKFLQKNIKQFKRKLTIKEILKFDFLIYWNKPKDFEQFKKLVK